MIHRELPTAIVLGALYLGLFIFAEVCSRLAKPAFEWPRKIVHIGGGLLSLSLPHFIHSIWTPLVLAALFSGICFIGQQTAFLRCLRVRKFSLGSELYPWAIFLVFVIARDQMWIYSSSILTLALADAGAALVGTTYGKHRYRIVGEDRTLEGSCVFMALAFLSVFVSMEHLGGFDGTSSAQTALAAALLTTSVEAVSPRGSDNLTIPLSLCLILPKLASFFSSPTF